jgi:peptidoglycan/LPS O-acetylase OafA/YrhL
MMAPTVSSSEAYANRLRALVFLAVAAVVTLTFYGMPAGTVTVAYALASALTAGLLICMLQSNMLDSSIWFRLAIAGLAAGCLASSMMPFAKGYTLGPWALMKAIALLAVVAMMRHRQLKSRDGVTKQAVTA